MYDSNKYCLKKSLLIKINFMKAFDKITCDCLPKLCDAVDVYCELQQSKITVAINIICIRTFMLI